MALDTADLDVTYSDFDLFSADAALPESHFLDYTRNTPNLHFDDVMDADETFSDTLFAQDVTVDARSTLSGENTPADLPGQNDDGDSFALLTEETKPEELIFNYRAVEIEIPPGVENEKPLAKKSIRRSKSRTAVRQHLSKHRTEEDRRKIQEKSQSDISDNLQHGVQQDTHKGFIRDRSHEQQRTTTAALLPGQPVNIPPSIAPTDKPRGSSWILRGVLFFIVSALAASLYAYRERDALMNSRLGRPVFVAACDLLSCQIPPRVDIDNLRAVDRSVVSHPTVADALIIKFGIVNQASFSQPYPILVIRLTDRAGRLVVTSRFMPDEYIRQWQEGDVLDVGKRLDIGLAVEDPGKSAMSFELDFLRAK